MVQVGLGDMSKNSYLLYFLADLRYTVYISVFVFGLNK